MSARTRRQLLSDGVSGLCAAGGAALLGAGLVRLAFAEDEPGDILVVVFLRGGWDGLTFLPPIGGPDRAVYEAARPTLSLPAKGPRAALPLDGGFGLHPEAAPLLDLYRGGRLAVVQAAGMTVDTRSHFDAQAYMDLGTPGRRAGNSGWIARHLLSRRGPGSFLTAAAIGRLAPTSLLGYPRAAIIGQMDGFIEGYNVGGAGDEGAQLEALRKMYAGDGWLARYGEGTLEAIEGFGKAAGSVKPAGEGYPNGEVGQCFRSLSQIVRLDLGLRVATIDVEGWDTHRYQGEQGRGRFGDRVAQLSRSLAAFHADMARDNGRRVAVVVMSEFGRRLQENASVGTDHGHGTVMLALGDGIAGGKTYGRWPGLDGDRLYQRADLAVTTDYRLVLSEILAKRLAERRLADVFPDFAGGEPLGLAAAS